MNYRSIFRADLFAGQTMMVTGGGSGIGRATAVELASLGAHVVLVGRTAEKLTAVAHEITKMGGEASTFTCNIREEAQVQALFAAVLAAHGALHGLVNNAGGQFLSPAEFISQKGFHAVVETNLTGTFLMCREAYSQHMRDHGGVIVNMLMENWRGFPGMVHSAAARAGIENLTKTLAVEWARSGVRINAVAPGLIESSGWTTTRMWPNSLSKTWCKTFPSSAWAPKAKRPQPSSFCCHQGPATSAANRFALMGPVHSGAKRGKLKTTTTLHRRLTGLNHEQCGWFRRRNGRLFLVKVAANREWGIITAVTNQQPTINHKRTEFRVVQIGRVYE
jgi:citronellol/citronellal dehydrogenase